MGTVINGRVPSCRRRLDASGRLTTDSEQSMTDAMHAALAALTMAFAPSATGAFHLSSTHLP